VYKEAFELGLFVTENVIDLQSKDNQLSILNRVCVLQFAQFTNKIFERFIEEVFSQLLVFFFP
jgi:hypothetical protein